MTSHGLIDTTEMYLRTVFELEEEGIVPLRARIAERLSQSGPTVSQTVARMERDGLLRVEELVEVGKVPLRARIAERLSQSGPTVSQTVARMERDGLLRVEGDRHLELTPTGRDLATRVMRKHRLAECLLVNVIGLPWEDVHIEACRWEHVMSEEVERRLVALLGNPTTCPHGNPIPGLAELGAPGADDDPRPLSAMTAVASPAGAGAVIRRISEQVQSDSDLMLRLKQIGIQPGREVTLRATDDGVRVISDDESDSPATELPRGIAEHVFVSRR